MIASPYHGVAVQAILRADRRPPFLKRARTDATAGRCTVRLISSHGDGLTGYKGALEEENKTTQ